MGKMGSSVSSKRVVVVVVLLVRKDEEVQKLHRGGVDEISVTPTKATVESTQRTIVEVVIKMTANESDSLVMVVKTGSGRNI